MRPARSIDFAALLLAVGCTPSERESEAVTTSAVASEPARTSTPVVVEAEPGPDRRELGPALGGRVTPRSPALGRWAASMKFEQHRFITMERTVGSRITGSVVMQLDAGGEARACVRVRERSESAVSHFESHDGKDHRSESDEERIVGMQGRWTQREGEPDIDVVFERMRWDGCAVDPTTPASAQPAMRCFAFAANDAVPRDALLCEVPESLHPLVQVSLLIGDSPRVGGWQQRFDPSGHGEVLPPDAKPQLLLGADPGLALTTHDDDRHPMPLTVRAAEVADPG